LQEYLCPVEGATPPDLVVQVRAISIRNEDVEIAETQNTYDRQLHGLQPRLRSYHHNEVPVNTSIETHVYGSSNIHCDINKSLVLAMPLKQYLFYSIHHLRPTQSMYGPWMSHFTELSVGWTCLCQFRYLPVQCFRSLKPWSWMSWRSSVSGEKSPRSVDCMLASNP